jgi:hypothetical protein
MSIVSPACLAHARCSSQSGPGWWADRIQARAIRRCGELVKQIKSASKANLKQGSRRAGALPSETRTAAAKKAGMSERQRKTALRVAAVPKPEF